MKETGTKESNGTANLNSLTASQMFALPNWSAPFSCPLVPDWNHGEQCTPGAPRDACSCWSILARAHLHEQGNCRWFRHSAGSNDTTLSRPPRTFFSNGIWPHCPPNSSMMRWIDLRSFLVTSSLHNWSFTKAVPWQPKISLVASSPNLLSGHVAQSNSTFWQYTCRSSFDGSYVGTRDASWFGTICVDGSTLAAATVSILKSSLSKDSSKLFPGTLHCRSSELRYQCRIPIKTTRSSKHRQFPEPSALQDLFPKLATSRDPPAKGLPCRQSKEAPGLPNREWLKLSHTAPSTGPPEPL